MPTRRQEILDAAIALLGGRGYADMRIEDVGQAVGISGPSVLEHFTTKQQMLVAAFDRAITQFMISAARAMDAATDAGEALVALVTELTSTVAHNGDLFLVLFSESGAVDDPDRERIRRLKRDHDDIWGAVIQQVFSLAGVETCRAIARAATEAIAYGWRQNDPPSASVDIVNTTLAFITGSASQMAHR